MGFLDGIIKKGIRDGISSGISNGISNVLEGKVGDKLTEALTPFGDAVGKFADTQEEARRSNDSKPVVSRGECLVDGNIEENFLAVLKSEFAEYELRQGVSPVELGGSDVARNYTFGLYQGGAPKMFIMLTPHNRYQNRPFREAKGTCERMGIPFLNFFTHFSNERNYVINRIRTALNS